MKLCAMLRQTDVVGFGKEKRGKGSRKKGWTDRTEEADFFTTGEVKRLKPKSAANGDRKTRSRRKQKDSHTKNVLGKTALDPTGSGRSISQR